MKTIIWICLLLTASLRLWGQDEEKTSDLVLQAACACMAEQGYNSETLDSSDTSADSCLQAAVILYLSPLLDEYQVDLDSDVDIQRIGQDLGRRLYQNCAAYREFSLSKSIKHTKEHKSPYNVTGGKLIALKTKKGQTKFTLETKDGEESFIWLREFDGSARFFKGLGNLKDKSVELSWKNIELYNPKLGQYETLKEVKLIEEFE